MEEIDTDVPIQHQDRGEIREVVLENRIAALECTAVELEDEIITHRLKLETAEAERDSWKIRYEDCCTDWDALKADLVDEKAMCAKAEENWMDAEAERDTLKEQVRHHNTICEGLEGHAKRVGEKADRLREALEKIEKAEGNADKVVCLMVISDCAGIAKSALAEKD